MCVMVSLIHPPPKESSLWLLYHIIFGGKKGTPAVWKTVETKSQTSSMFQRSEWGAMGQNFSAHDGAVWGNAIYQGWGNLSGFLVDIAAKQNISSFIS